MRTLLKIDPERHMHRWYAVGIQSPLVEELAVVYGWGSLNSAFQQWRKSLSAPRKKPKGYSIKWSNSTKARIYSNCAGNNQSGFERMKFYFGGAAVPESIVQIPEG